MKLTVSINHPDVAQKPVDVRVWRDGEEVISTKFQRTPATPRTLNQFCHGGRLLGDRTRVVCFSAPSRS
jgi:hypothetical protein